MNIPNITNITRQTDYPSQTDTASYNNINMISREVSIICCDDTVETTTCSSASTVCMSNITSRRVNGSRLEKQHLMEFTRVLMKYLQTMNPSLYNEAQAVICDSFQRHMTEELSVDCLKKRIRKVTGDCYWLRAEQYYKRMLMMQRKEMKVQKKEQKRADDGQQDRVEKRVHWRYTSI
jgi:hypothetical protein